MSTARRGRVILIAGPAGSGKTTAASRIAQNKNWVMLSEDEAWAKIKEGHPADEGRTPAEETVVQALTLEKIVSEVERGHHVVLEFILYSNPPTPLIFYREGLLDRNIDVTTRLLKASEDEIWQRKVQRGREWDKNEALQRTYAKHQLSCLAAAYVAREWVIDTSGKSAENVYQECFAQLV